MPSTPRYTNEAMHFLNRVLNETQAVILLGKNDEQWDVKQQRKSGDR
jgi:hypothetical protein